jgi:hypothetical protein
VTVGSIRQVSVSYSCVIGVVGAGILSAVLLVWLAQATMIFRDLHPPPHLLPPERSCRNCPLVYSESIGSDSRLRVET